MRVMILANDAVGLYQFRRELIEQLLYNNKVVISLPYGARVELLKAMGCKFVETPVDRRGINPLKDLKLYQAYRRLLRTEKPDLVITYTIKPNIYGGVATRIARIPYAVNITGLGTAFQKEGLLRKLVTLMYRTACKRAKVVFFENTENRQVFLSSGIVKEGQTCLLNGAGVNLQHFQLMPYPAFDGITRFLFIGRVMREKGIDELFSAIQKLRATGVQCTLDVVGPCEERYSDILAQFQNEGWLRYHGYQTDVRPFIEACHCFVLPSWHEGMANTNLECAAIGRPVITSNIHGCLEAVVDGVSGYLCEKQNADALYETMKKFTTLSRTEREAMGIVGRERMEALFDKNKVVNETITHLEGVLNERA